MKHITHIFVLSLLLSTLGCARTQEVAKIVWGNTTKALEQGRVNALSKKFSCSYNECFDVVTEMGEHKIALLANGIDEEMVEKRKFLVFSKNKSKNLIVIMNIPGSIDTTEAGIFFTNLESNKTKIEITSRSSSAKYQTADMVFEELAKYFSVVD